jgi:hypothetical protein
MDGPSDVDLGRWLVEQRASLDRGEAEWLEGLATFDRDQMWALDGHFCCATWLVWQMNMARPTAFEKLRVAHELERRPVIREAFRQRRLSYSAVRAITRMDRPDPEVDEALVELAAGGQATILDLEKVVRSYRLYADQERPPAEDPQPVRDVKIRRGADGTGQVVLTLSDLEIEEFSAALQAFIDRRYRPVPVDGYSAGDSHGSEAPLEQAGRAARKADAFTDMVHAALHAADGGQAAGDDRYMVHLVTRDQGRSLHYLDGTPAHPADAASVGCDCATVTHTVDDQGEPLNLGRRTREWSTAQRRAIAVRDGGHCRFPGCTFTHYDIHHMRSWEEGGPTDIANGFCQCRRHHRMLHSGYQVKGGQPRTGLLPARRHPGRGHAAGRRPDAGPRRRSGEPIVR